MHFTTIDGWLTPREGEELARLSKGKLVLEIGSYCGRSTTAMQECKALLSIDPHDSSTTEPHPKRDTLNSFLWNVATFPVIPLLGKIEDLVSFLVPSTFDLIFIDGDHSFDACTRDIQLAQKLIKPNGIIAVHDYGTPYPQLFDVTRAIDALWLSSDFYVIDSLAVKK